MGIASTQWCVGVGIKPKLSDYGHAIVTVPLPFVTLSISYFPLPRSHLYTTTQEFGNERVCDHISIDQLIMT